MRIIYLGIMSLFITSPAWSDTSFEPLLNTVALQFSAEQWVTTKTALVTVGVNASVSGNALDKTQGEVLNKLNQISNKGEWHIISFLRNLDQSGLERVQIAAQVRLGSSDLPGLRDKAKAISVPGETFTVDNIEFTPSADELRAANANLRNDIYQQAIAELSTLNKLYSDQKYYLHSVSFVGDIAVPQAQFANYKLATAAASPSPARTISVGDKLNLSATVVLAAAPNQDVAKLVHN